MIRKPHPLISNISPRYVYDSDMKRENCFREVLRLWESEQLVKISVSLDVPGDIKRCRTKIERRPLRWDFMKHSESGLNQERLYSYGRILDNSFLIGRFQFFFPRWIFFPLFCGRCKSCETLFVFVFLFFVERTLGNYMQPKFG